MKLIKMLVGLLIITAVFFACSENNETASQDHSSHELKSAEDEVKSELVRKGIIDIESIDINSDGKIYECPMDWNVLDDKAGNCPTCGMNLKEYTLDEVKANLSKYGYEYKN